MNQKLKVRHVEQQEILKELENILSHLSIDLKYGRGYFEGGLYRYKNQKVIYLNRTHSIDKHIDIVCRELKKHDLEGIHIIPEIQNCLKNPEDN